MSTISPARVVVVDDSALMRNIVTRSLTRAGVQVVGSARDGDEALALCARASRRDDARSVDAGSGRARRAPGPARAVRPPHLGGRRVGLPAAHGARAVDALAEGAFDLVKPCQPVQLLETIGKALA